MNPSFPGEENDELQVRYMSVIHYCQEDRQPIPDRDMEKVLIVREFAEYADTKKFGHAECIKNALNKLYCYSSYIW
jgi:hypothetical protein